MPPFRIHALPALLMSGFALTGCAMRPPVIAYDDPPGAATHVAARNSTVVVEVPKPLPLPGQLKPLPGRGGRSAAPEAQDPRARVAQANAAARLQPTRAGYINAVQVYPYSAGALYQVYTTPGSVTDIALQPGENLVGTGPVAAGDTVRWVIGDTESGTGEARRVHILVKPTRADLWTNLVINTDRRTYHLELRSAERAYMASVSWQYAGDQLIGLRRDAWAAAAATPASSSVDISRMRFRYAIDGDSPPWRPVLAFDDGRHVFIEFPRGIGQGEMPPLFVVGPNGDTSELVNYRVQGHRMVVDRLFAAAELRFGSGWFQQRVRIVRTDGSPA